MDATPRSSYATRMARRKSRARGAEDLEAGASGPGRSPRRDLEVGAFAQAYRDVFYRIAVEHLEELYRDPERAKLLHGLALQIRRALLGELPEEQAGAKNGKRRRKSKRTPR